MMKTLLLVDAHHADRTAAAVAEVIRRYRQAPAAVTLLSVQPLMSSHVAMFFGAGEMERMQQEAGQEDLQAACALLDAASVPYTVLVRAGRSAETIARVAKELGCDGIVMGGESKGSRAGAMFGSLATQVHHIVSGGKTCQVIVS